MISSESLTAISLDDTSPCVSYSPFRDTFSTPNLIAGWNPYFNSSGFVASQGDIGKGTSMHITSLDGAALGIQWNGTGIKLLGNVTQASYTITLDGTLLSDAESLSPDLNNNVLANIRNLPDALHTIRLTAKIPQDSSPPNSSMLVFDQAILSLSSPTGLANDSTAGLNNQTALADQNFAFRGLWSITSNVASAFTQFTSKTRDDIATIVFNGTTFLMHGESSPQAGEYSISLDNAIPAPFSARASFTQPNALLFFASDLDPQKAHVVTVRNTAADGEGSVLSLLLDGFEDNLQNPSQSPTDTKTNTNTNTINPPSPTATGSTRGAGGRKVDAAPIAGGVVGFIALSALTIAGVVALKRRHRRRRRVYLESSERSLGDGMG